MNTPRSGLIRATEGAIKEYIKDGCAENLPMIRQLEDVAFQIWVESNTSFMNETIETLEDEDGYIWDEEYLFQSFSAHADDNMMDAEEDANSSICSSIKPCDETDCSYGYLASCEDNDVLELSDIESWDLSECYNGDVNVADKIDGCLPDNEQNEQYIEAESFISVSCVNLSHDDKTCCLRTRSNKPGTVNEQKHRTTKNFSEESPVCLHNGAQIMELENNNDDEWVVVNYDKSKCDPDSEWFIVSVNETCETKLEKMRRKEASPIDICRNNLEINAKRFTDNKSDKDGIVDLSEWAVLSMKITERSKVSKKIGMKNEDATDLRCGINSPDVKTSYEFTTPVEFIQETLGIIGQNSCEKTNINICPLCRDRKDKYKCAIFCLLLK